MHPIAAQRLHNQQLVAPTCRTPAEVVAWLGAVQSQDFAAAKWALALRVPGMTDAEIERDYNEGTFLRLHVMRPTWHFVVPEDIRWIVELTAPRVNAQNGYRYRQLELDEPTLARGCEVVSNALRGGNYLTREELRAVLEQAGIAADGQRMAYILHRAELEALICSGPRRGKQFTYALLDERAPNAKSLPRDEALAELTRRYFTSHGPAQAKDFVWWSGLTVADVKAGLEMAKAHLVEETIDGKTYWRGETTRDASVPESPHVLLIPPFDEYTIAYKDHSAVLDAALPEPPKMELYGGVTVIDGQVVGVWRRTFSGGAVVFESKPYRPFSNAEQNAFAAAAQRYGAFLQMPVTLA